MSETRYKEVWILIRTGARNAVQTANHDEDLDLRLEEELTDNFRVSSEAHSLIVEVWRSQELVYRRTQLGEIKHGLVQFIISDEKLPHLVRVNDDSNKMVAIEEFIQGILECFRPAYARS